MDIDCYTCRRRRIQCDRAQIPCTKCQKGGLECHQSRPYRWVKGVAVRGKMQGVSYKPTHVAGDGMTVLKTPGMDTPSVPRGLGDNSTSYLDGVSRYYLDYYNHRICKLFIVYDSDQNPFRSLVSLSFKDPVLLNAVIALAARHRANEGRSFHDSEGPACPGLIDARRDALAFKHRAIKGLLRMVADAPLCEANTTVASCFLLIFLDLLESGNDRWNFHLEGAKALIASNASLSAENKAGCTLHRIWAFITREIYLIETLGATFVRPRLLSQAPISDQPGLFQQDIVEQSFLGCPGYLLGSIQFFSHQRDIVAGLEPFDTSTTSIPASVHSTKSMLESVQNFDSYFWASNLPRARSSPQNIHNLSTLCQTYKLGTLVYGQRVLDAVLGETTPQDDRIDDLLEAIGALRYDTTLFKCILWPILVAGLECRRSAQREFLVMCLEEFWEVTRCSNVINAGKILQMFWREEERGKLVSSKWVFHICCLDQDWLLI